MSLSQEILDIVGAARKPVDAATIHDRSELSESRSRTSSTVSALVCQGRLERIDPASKDQPKRYRLPGAQAAQTSGRRAAGKKAAGKKAEVESASADGGREAAAAPAREDDPVREHLVANAKQNQEAIDAYLRQVGDPAVVAALTASRDRAWEALTTYDQVAPA